MVAWRKPAKMARRPPRGSAWPEPEVVQRALHKLPWGVNLELLDAAKERKVRLWYAERAFEHGWSHTVLSHIERGLDARQGKHGARRKGQGELR